MDDFGEVPDYGVFSLTLEFVKRLHELVALTRHYGLESVTVDAPGFQWGPKGEADDLQLEGSTLVVNSLGDFQVISYPKNASYTVETRLLSLDAVMWQIEAVNGPEPSGFYPAEGVLFYAEDPEDTKPMADVYFGANGKAGGCADCGKPVQSLIGCPDGAEICQACFDNGAH